MVPEQLRKDREFLEAPLTKWLRKKEQGQHT